MNPSLFHAPLSGSNNRQDQENLFHKLQSGFRHNHSTATAMIHLIDTMYQDMDES